jgi:hypothetical protein
VLAGIVLLLGLTVWQLRWGYFLLLAFAMSLPWMLRAFRSNGIAWFAFAIGLWPLARSWKQTLHPPEDVMEDQARRRLSQFRFRTIAVKMSDGPRTGFIAPWWVSPQIAYWSGQPGVAGTSHQSLPGIVDTARFYLSTDDAKAEEILRRRQAGWVVIDNNSSNVAQGGRLLAITDSEIVLGTRAAEEPLGLILAEHPRQAPKFLSEIGPEELGLVLHLSPKDSATTGDEGIRIYATQMHRLYRVLTVAP